VERLQLKAFPVGDERSVRWTLSRSRLLFVSINPQSSIAGVRIEGRVVAFVPLCLLVFKRFVLVDQRRAKGPCLMGRLRHDAFRCQHAKGALRECMELLLAISRSLCVVSSASPGEIFAAWLSIGSASRGRSLLPWSGGAMSGERAVDVEGTDRDSRIDL